jgi:hypothetical protein
MVDDLLTDDIDAQKVSGSQAKFQKFKLNTFKTFVSELLKLFKVALRGEKKEKYNIRKNSGGRLCGRGKVPGKDRR